MMQRWEYMRAVIKWVDVAARLDECGADGWELVSTVAFDGDGEVNAFFKRPAPEQQDT